MEPGYDKRMHITGKMASVLPLKTDDLSSDPQTPHQKAGKSESICNPRTPKVRRKLEAGESEVQKNGRNKVSKGGSVVGENDNREATWSGMINSLTW